MQRIIVIGGGLAGSLTARLLSRHSAQSEVVLVDGQDAFVFKARLIDALANPNLPRQRVEVPLTQLAERFGYRYQPGWVSKVQLDRRSIELMGNGRLAYDYLVVAIGSRRNFYQVPGAAQYSIAYNSYQDIVRLAARSQQLPRGSRVVVVGGGLAGVELAGSLSQLLAGRGVAVCLINAKANLASEAHPRCQRIVYRTLASQGVELHTGTAVVAVGPEGVTLNSGQQIKSQLVVWAAGVQPNQLQFFPSLPIDRHGFLRAEPTLRLTERVFGAGDCISFDNAGVPALPCGQRARAMAFQVAAAMTAAMASRPLPTFTYQSKGLVIRLGRTALLDLNWLQLHGRLMVPLRDLLYRQRMSEVTGQF